LIRRRQAARLLAAGVSGMLLSCSRERLSMHVEIDVFSGRPNPAFELSVDEAKHLLALLEGLPEIPPTADEDALGYRGMNVTIAKGDDNNPVRRIRVSGGVVAIGRATGTRYFRDTRAVEKWLIERAADNGHGSLVGPPL
jgi:hypothetical protein